MMWTVGITGLSGSGKSSLAAYYKSRGFAAEDGDTLSRVVCAPQSACVAALCAAFGNDVVDETGALRRRALGEKVYQSPSLNRRLIDIVHPYVLEELKTREKAAQEAGMPFLFLDGAMIVGSIFEEHCHKLILVEATPTFVLERILLRDGISKEVAQNRLAAQKSTQELRSASDYMVQNNGDLHHLHKQADLLLEKLQDAQQKALANPERYE